MTTRNSNVENYYDGLAPISDDQRRNIENNRNDNEARYGDSFTPDPDTERLKMERSLESARRIEEADKARIKPKRKPKE